ncbi:MAG TPA: hypothetical protein VF585_04460 [Chthoniobacterales bacterium]
MNPPSVSPLRTLFRRAAFVPFCGALGLAAAGNVQAAATVDLTSPTTGWTVIQYPNNNPDPSTDQQTGSTEADIVGDALHPSFYTQFGNAGTPSLTDGTLAFRIRLGADQSPDGFKAALFVGIDATGDGGIDLFLASENTGNPDRIGIYNPGTGLNLSPNTTSIVATPLVSYTPTASNYYWAPVDPTIDPTVGTSTDMNIDGKVDHFLTFSLPFADVVAQMAARNIVINQNSTFNYVLATSTQNNSLNQDLNGIGKGFINSTSTWAELGGLTSPISASGVAVPEPDAAVCVGLGAVGLLAWRFRRSARKSSLVG